MANIRKKAYQLNNHYFANLTNEETVVFKKILLKINETKF